MVFILELREFVTVLRLNMHFAEGVACKYYSTGNHAPNGFSNRRIRIIELFPITWSFFTVSLLICGICVRNSRKLCVGRDNKRIPFLLRTDWIISHPTRRKTCCGKKINCPHAVSFFGWVYTECLKRAIKCWGFILFVPVESLLDIIA